MTGEVVAGTVSTSNNLNPAIGRFGLGIPADEKDYLYSVLQYCKKKLTSTLQMEKVGYTWGKGKV